MRTVGDINPKNTTYNIGMKGIKKSIIVCCIAVAFVFSAAIGLCVRALYAPQEVFATGGELKILLDAGHGGIDGGVTGKKTGAKESDINLQITFALKAELEEKGFTVALTRKTAEGLYDTTAKGFKKRDMQRRKEIIEKEKPLMVISIHQNYYASQSQRGAQVFYGENHPKSRSLATLLQTNLNALYEKQGVKNRKSAFGDYFMLKCYSAPAVIVECGFLSSPADEALLVDTAWQKTLAKGIAEGVLNYFTDLTA